MGTIAGHGLSVAVPVGWDARITRRAPEAIPGALRPASAETDTWTGAILHAASFALPPGMADFGGGAVDLMAASDVLVVLFEYGPDSVGMPLFAAQGLPRRLTEADFSPDTLRKLLKHQSGVQRFFTEAGRAFCLYVVLGAHTRRFRSVPLANEVLKAVTIT